MRTHTTRLLNLSVVIAMMLMAIGPMPVLAMPAQSEATSSAPQVSQPTQSWGDFIVSEPTAPIDTTGLPLAQPPAAYQGQLGEQPGFELPKADRLNNAPHQPDSALQTEAPSGVMPPPLTNWDGIPNTGVQPPDTDGQIGPNHYVQIVNTASEGSQIRVWDKSGNQLYDFGMNSMWPAGDRCHDYGYGDPVVLYDQLADRWLLTQFIYPPSGPYSECFAVSKTGTPTNNPSDWWLYNFVVSTNNFPDYPKIAVWPDGYYMMAHQFLNASTWNGTGVWVFDRAKMLNGQAATFQYKDLYPINPDYGGMLPSNLMGSTLPPAGSPNYFVEVDQTLGTQNYLMTIFAFHTDWTTPANTTFSVVGTHTVDPFDMDLCPAARERCIDQPGRPASLEAITDRLMMHLWYRNYGDHEALVTNHTVDGDGAGHAGIRWYELRKTTPAPSAWSIYQQGTYFPTADHRWMGSVAMDHVGNMALGYSVSSLTTYPSVRYAGRLASDPLGTLAQTENSLVEGGGSFSGYRWGDYSAMSVDPVDDCTFWYTQEYVKAGQTSWSTRVGSFKFPSCSIGPQGILSGTVRNSGSSPIANAAIQATASMTQTGGTTSAADGSYSMNLLVGTYVVTATAYGYLPSTVNNVVINANATTVQNFTLTAAPAYTVSGTVRDGLTGWPLYARITIDGYPGAPIWTNPATGQYSIVLVGGTTYNFNVATFSPGYVGTSRSVGPLTANQVENFNLNVDQNTCTAPGYYLNVIGVNEPFDATTIPAGWTSTNNGGTCSWVFNNPGGRSNLTGGSGNFAIADSDICGSGTTMSTTLTSPAFDVSALSTVNMAFKYDYYNLSSSEVAAVDISANNGTTWTNLFSWNSSHRGPATYSQDVTSLIGGATQARLRWRYVAPGWDWWWQVDDVFVGQKQCLPRTGGLVVGTVTDGNSGAGLLNAKVENQAGFNTLTVDTPADPNELAGFYTLFSPAGTQVFTATKSQYGPSVASVSVPLSGTVRQNFVLNTGHLVYTPPAISVSFMAGMSATLPVTVSNIGIAAAHFDIQETDQGGVPYIPTGNRPPYKARVAPYSAPEEVNHSLIKPPATGPVTPNTWGTGASIPTGARYRSAGTTCDGKDLYVFGGQSGGGVTLNESWKYDSQTNTWTALAAMPTALMSMEAACYQGLIYLVGGYTGSAHTNSFLIYNTSTNTWTTSTWPATRTPMTAIYGTTLYAFGGNPGPSSEVRAYDILAGTWSGPLAALPTATTYGAAVRAGNYLYVVGGADAAGAAVSAVQRYDPTANTWATGPALPNGRMNPTTAWYGNRLYVAGGGGSGGDIWTSYNDTYYYDLSAWPGGSWTNQGETIPTPVLATAHDCVNNRIYAAAGTSAGSYYATLQYLDDGQTCNIGGASADVPWITEVPISATVAASGMQVVNVTVDSASVVPGIYRAALKFNNDTPYPLPNLPVTMTVTVPPTWGKLTGNVSTMGYCDANPAALKNVTVTIQSALNTWAVRTDNDGNYAQWLDVSNNPLTVTVTPTGYAPGLATGVTVIGQGTTTQDFSLRLLRPCVSVSPPAYTATLNLGQTTSRILRTNNNGGATAIYSMTEQYISAPSLPVYVPGSIGAVPAPINGRSFSANPAPPATQSNQAPLPTAPTAISLTHSLSQLIVSGNSVACNNGVAHTDNHYLRVFDLPAFGISGPLNVTAIQMGIEMASAGSGGVQPAQVRLYTLSGALQWANMTQIGSANINVANQSLTILNTPIAAMVPAGSKLVVDFFTPNGQTANNLMFVGSNSLGQTGPSYIAAADCGAAEPTDLASLGFPGMHIVMNVIADNAAGGGDVVWLTETPVSGTIPSDSFVNTTIGFNANAVALPGTYKANVNVNSNDTVNPVRQSAMTMIVNAPANWGVLTGTVTSLGHCDVTPAPLGGATLVLQGTSGPTRTVTTDGSGRYTLWLDSLASPYTLSASAANHLPPTPIGGIAINQLGAVTVQNVSMRSVQPCVSYTPPSIAVTVPWAGTASRTVTLTNSGTASSLFTVTEQAGGFIPMLPEATPPILIVNAGSANTTRAYTTALTNLGFSYVITTSTAYATIPTPTLMTGYQAVFYGGYPSALSTQMTKTLDYLNAGGRFFISDNDFGYGYRNYTTTASLYRDYFQGTYGADAGSDGVITGTDIMAGIVTDISSDPYPDSFTINGPDGVGVFYNITPGTWAGERIARLGYKAIYLAWDYEYAGGSTVGDPVETTIMQQVVNWLGLTAADYIPWLTEAPTQGSLPAPGQQAVTFNFDATVPEVTQPGTYYGTVVVKTQDLVNSTANVPVTMTVQPPATQAKLNGTVRGLGYCDANPAPLSGATVLVQGSGGYNIALTTNAAGYYQQWIDAAQAPLTLTVSAANHVGQVISVPSLTGGMTTTQDVNLRWNRPCEVVTPSSLSANLQLGASMSTSLNLGNTGPVTLSFQLKEADRGMVPAQPSAVDVLVVDKGGSNSANVNAFTVTLNALGYTYYVTASSTSTGVPVNLANYKYVLYAGYPGAGAEETQLMAYMDGGGSVLVADNDFGYFRGSSTIYQTYFEATYGSDAGSDGVVDGVDIMSGILTDISSDPYPDNFTLNGPDATGIFANTPPRTGWAGSRIARGIYKAIYLAWDFQYTGGTAITATDKALILGRALQWLTPTDLLWVSETPTSGDISPNTGQQVVDVTFDAGAPGVTQPGNFYGDLVVLSNDPVYGTRRVPITMTVTVPGTWAKFNGAVSTQGICDVNPAPLNNATVFVETRTGLTYTLHTNAAGYYQIWTDVVNAPLTMTASAPNHLSSVVTGITGTGGTTVTTDIKLRFNAPCQSSTPSSMASTQYVGTQTNRTLYITNTGAAPLNWVITEQPNAMRLKSDTPTAEVKLVSDGIHSFSVNSAVPLEAFGGTVAPTDAISITESASQNVMSSNSVSCNASGLHAENSYYRVFDLPAFGITGEFNTSGVEIGVELATAGGSTQPLSVKLYTLSGPFILANLTPIGSADFQIANQSLSHLFLPITTTVPAGSKLVVEILTPDGQAAGNSFFIGSNNLGETAPGYLRAPDCGITEPTSTSAIGFPDMHIVMNVYGSTGAACGDVNLSWVSATPISGTTAANGGVSPVTVTFNSTGLEAGLYKGNLCLDSNDPIKPFSTIPVTLTVIRQYDVKVDPHVGAASGDPRAVVSYTLRVTNTGTANDTFALTTAGNAWNTQVSPAQVSLPAGSGASVMVYVTVANVMPNATDVVTVTATSQGDSQRHDVARLTTTANPLYAVDLWSPARVLTGDAGKSVTYTLWVSNTGNLTGTFTFAAYDYSWPVHLPGNVVIGPYGSVMVPVVMDIPAGTAGSQSDPFAVKASIVEHPTSEQILILTTLANARRLYLPLIVR